VVTVAVRLLNCYALRTRRDPMKFALLSLALVAAGAAFSVRAQGTQVPNDGYLCCNLHVNGTWASDANAPRQGDRVLPAGTRVTGLAYGSAQIDVEVQGQKISIGNDYSRAIPMNAFANRWIVPKNPLVSLRAWSPKVQQAVKAGRITQGMSRKQVLMSLGWPTATSTPNLEDPVWQYTARNGTSFKVVFNPAWLVKAVDTDAETKKVVLLP
jgi:hypothetical protein